MKFAFICLNGLLTIILGFSLPANAVILQCPPTITLTEGGNPPPWTVSWGSNSPYVVNLDHAELCTVASGIKPCCLYFFGNTLHYTFYTPASSEQCIVNNDKKSFTCTLLSSSTKPAGSEVPPSRKLIK